MTIQYNTVLITGAGGGLGLALSRWFLEHGSRVCGIARRSTTELADLSNDFPETFLSYLADVSDEEAVRSAAEYFSDKISGIDIIINNAAVHLEQDRPDLGNLDFKSYLKSFDINSVGPLRIAQYFLPLLRNGTAKRIVSISSEAGSISDCWRDREYSYCMSKAALNMGMRILQNRLKPEGIRILLIHPGWIRTRMGGQNADLSADESARAVAELLSRYDGDGLYLDWTGKELPW